jgi:hypothetical protein
MLLARCELQRQDLGFAIEGLQPVVRALDTVNLAASKVRAHPFLATALAVAVIVVVRPRRLLSLLPLALSTALAARRVVAPWRLA